MSSPNRDHIDRIYNARTKNSISTASVKAVNEYKYSRPHTVKVLSARKDALKLHSKKKRKIFLYSRNRQVIGETVIPISDNNTFHIVKHISKLRRLSGMSSSKLKNYIVVAPELDLNMTLNSVESTLRKLNKNVKIKFIVLSRDHGGVIFI
jgi:hypothetical protein